MNAGHDIQRAAFNPIRSSSVRTESVGVESFAARMPEPRPQTRVIAEPASPRLALPAGTISNVFANLR